MPLTVSGKAAHERGRLALVFDTFRMIKKESLNREWTLIDGLRDESISNLSPSVVELSLFKAVSFGHF